MYKKILISIITLFLLTSVSILSFATEEGKDGQDVVNDVRNAVGGAENAVEDAARDVSNTSKDATGNFENTMSNVTDNGKTNDNDNNYTAVRTGTDVGDATLMGMNSTTWTWIILAIAAVGVIALIWAFSTQNNDKQQQ